MEIVFRNSFRKIQKAVDVNVPPSETPNVSVFQRRAEGVKPWLNCGLGLVSCGNKQLDDILGGGIPLGTVTMICSDHFTSYGSTLLGYVTAESVSLGHDTLLLVTEKTNTRNYLSLFLTISLLNHLLLLLCQLHLFPLLPQLWPKTPGPTTKTR